MPGEQVIKAKLQKYHCLRNKTMVIITCMTPFNLILRIAVSALGVLLIVKPHSVARVSHINASNASVVRFAGFVFLAWVIVRLAHKRDFTKFDLWEEWYALSTGAICTVIIVFLILSKRKCSDQTRQ
jgi:hypothetical protein